MQPPPRARMRRSALGGDRKRSRSHLSRTVLWAVARRPARSGRQHPRVCPCRWMPILESSGMWSSSVAIDRSSPASPVSQHLAARTPPIRPDRLDRCHVRRDRSPPGRPAGRDHRRPATRRRGLNRRVIELRDRGVRVSIDDFGTGSSSLASFRNMPIDGLKLDRMFVSALGKAREETAIVTAAIGFGDALGVAVTGEGIETAEQLALLRKLGCRFGQGFLISRPTSIDAVRAMQAPFDLPTRPSAAGRTTAA